MHTHPSKAGHRPQRARRFVFAFVPALLLVLAALSGCAAPRSTTVSAAERESTFRQAAADYAAAGDISAIRARLDKLGLANPAQFVVAQAEADLSAGKSRTEIESLAKLAEALGARSARLVAYLAPTPEPLPPTAAPVKLQIAPLATAAPQVAAVTVVAEVLSTALPATATAVPPTPAPPSATPAPQKPRVIADSSVNLRSGPGKAYPVVGKLNANQEVNIAGRNASGDWWEIDWPGATQAWVAGTVVRVLGAIDTVAEVQDIPAPPPSPTPAPRPTAAPAAPAAPTAAPRAAVDYRVIETRMLTIQENGGCMGNHHFYVQVVDAGGAPVNGAVVRRQWAPAETRITGEKDCYWHVGAMNEGCASFDIYQAGDNLFVAEDPTLGAVSSETSRTLTTLDVGLTVDELMATGYCTEGRENCEWRKNPGGNLPPQLCNGHYSWFVKFQRTR